MAQWAALRTRLARQKINNPNKAFNNLLASWLDDVKDRLILLYLILTLSLSAAKCERGSRKTLAQDTLSGLITRRSSNSTRKRTT